MIRHLLALVCIAFALSGSVTSAAEATINLEHSCNLPHANFKYSYMDSVLSAVKKPDRGIFMKSASNHMDSTKAQFYLWYVYRNPNLSNEFFKKINIWFLVKRYDDAS